MASGLAIYLQQLRASIHGLPKTFEPDVDDRELGVDDAAKFREDEDLKSGAVLKATVQPGEGDAKPQEGDLVFVHYSLMDEHQEVFCSTLAQHGGNGQPQPFVIGRGRRMLRGMELGVLEMRRNERAMLEIRPDYAFQHKESGLPLPESMRREAPVVADVMLVCWFPGNGIKCLGPTGNIFLRTLRAGHGWESPRPPFEVALHLSARTACSLGQHAQAESYYSSSSEEPIECSLGSGQLPQGVEAALQAMQRQQRAIAYCPTVELCGSRLMGDPPGNGAQKAAVAAPAYSEVELHLLDFAQVRDVTGDGSVVKRTLHKGIGEFPVDCPLEDSRVRIHFRVKAAGQQEWLLETRGADGQAAPVEFDTGMGEAPEALDMCVRLMLRGEVALVTSSWQYAYEGRQDMPAGLAAGSPVQFEVELVDFEQEPSQHVLSGADKLQRAARLKEQGNALFKQGRTKLARQKYQKALKLVSALMDLDSDEEFAAANATKAACLLNLARCAEKEQAWGEALSWCNKAISEDDKYAKAYFRRAVISACLGELESAGTDLAICAELDESTAEDCERELRRMERQAAAAEAKQRDSLKGFFQR